MGTNETISISEFKATCLAVLDKVKRTGQAILVTRRGEPIAMIDPPPPPETIKSWIGTYRSKGKIVGDIQRPAASKKEWAVLNE